jgi:hypothetical protein
MRNNPLLLAALMLVPLRLLAQSEPAAAGPVTIPFTLSDGVLMIPATVGTIPIHVILDTGAGLDILAPSLIARLHGRAAGSFSAHRMTGERIDVPLFEIPEIAVGAFVRKNVVVGGWDMLDTLHLEGIVSVNGFRQRPFTIDFGRGTLVLETPQSLNRRRAGGQVSPLKVDDYHGAALDLIATFRIGDEPGDCEIDTGSQSATVSLRYLVLLGVDTNSAEVRKRERRTIAGAREVSYGTSVSQIALASAPAIALRQPRVAFADIIYDCVIGTDFWAGRALTIDLAGGVLIVSSPHP